MVSVVNVHEWTLTHLPHAVRSALNALSRLASSILLPFFLRLKPSQRSWRPVFVRLLLQGCHVKGWEGRERASGRGGEKRRAAQHRQEHRCGVGRKNGGKEMSCQQEGDD